MPVLFKRLLRLKQITPCGSTSEDKIKEIQIKDNYSVMNKTMMIMNRLF